jgi:DNA-binding CsgD family transcriptional regulator
VVFWIDGAAGRRLVHGNPCCCSRHKQARCPRSVSKTEVEPGQRRLSVYRSKQTCGGPAGLSARCGGLNWSAQHSNLLAKMECGHETATSHLLLSRPAIRDLGSLAGRRADDFDRTPICPASVFSVISPTGGIRPPDRHRAKQALSLSEREEISRWLSMRCSLRSIARHLGRSPSTISREVQRNGGTDRYRAARSDQAAWDRARRPKLCKLACRPFLRRTVSTLLRRQWSPEQIAGWLKRIYPAEPQKQVSHEMIYRSLFIQASAKTRQLRATSGNF